jgi:hypothetical protein
MSLPPRVQTQWCRSHLRSWNSVISLALQAKLDSIVDTIQSELKRLLTPLSQDFAVSLTLL